MEGRPNRGKKNVRLQTKTDTCRRGLNLQCFVDDEALLTNSDAADAIRLDYQLLPALLSSRGGT